MRDLDGKVAVVTGAASGIGRALATYFAREGMSVVLADIEQPALDAAVAELRQQERNVIGVVADVSVADQIEALAESAVAAFGKVHVVCNNAGVSASGPDIASTALEDWEWVLGVNFWGVLHGVKAFLPILEQQGEEGHIVNTASIAGLMAAGSASPYAVSKHAVVAFSEGLHRELKSRESSVHVSVLCPYWVRTRILEAGRNRPPEFALETAELSEAQRARRAAVSAAIGAGATPERIAEMVLAAIREERFYILSHPGTGEVVRARMEAIIDGRDPPAPVMTALRNPD